MPSNVWSLALRSAVSSPYSPSHLLPRTSRVPMCPQPSSSHTSPCQLAQQHAPATHFPGPQTLLPRGSPWQGGSAGPPFSIVVESSTTFTAFIRPSGPWGPPDWMSFANSAATTSQGTSSTLSNSATSTRATTTSSPAATTPTVANTPSGSASAIGTSVGDRSGKTAIIVVAVLVPIVCVILALTVILLFRRRLRRRHALAREQEPIPFVGEQAISPATEFTAYTYVGGASGMATVGRHMSMTSTQERPPPRSAVDRRWSAPPEKAQREVIEHERHDTPRLEEHPIPGSESDIPSEAPPAYYSE